MGYPKLPNLQLGIIIIVNSHHVYKSSVPISVNPKTIILMTGTLSSIVISMSMICLQCIEIDMTLLEGSMYSLQRC